MYIKNAGRSQIAESFFNTKHMPKLYRTISAGTKSASQILPLAILMMKEVEIDITKQK
jgi:protein-tyrosine-phosphatase